MVVICFEGIDGVGKSTIANQLVEKYEDRIDGFIHFPTYEAKKELERLNVTEIVPGFDVNRSRLLYYALRYMIFYQDFRRAGWRHAGELPRHVHKKDKREEYRKNTLFIIDRYWLSNLFYYKYAFEKYADDYHNDMNTNFWHPWNLPEGYLLPVPIDLLVLVYSHNPIIKPDNVFTRDELLIIQHIYKRKLIDFSFSSFTGRIKEVVTVEGLQPNSFEKTEAWLKKKGILK